MEPEEGRDRHVGWTFLHESTRNRDMMAADDTTTPPQVDSARLTGLTTAIGLDSPDPADETLLGRAIGGARVIRLIAEGGMGRIYEAEQEKPRRRVAVKLMRSGVASPSLLRRFEYEVEILGRLQHPGIARVYSAGVHTDHGASFPFFIMEYVDCAKPLTQYATDNALSAAARLQLFRTACEAVAYGHHKGVIHRDLKPGNILVDATGTAKIIDFGVARGTEVSPGDATMHTESGQIIGTLQYMSPEQVSGASDDVDIRADVYSLGLILWELMTDGLPYSIRGKSIMESSRIIQDFVPQLTVELRQPQTRDIGQIALKCLEKDREKRYSSASALADDIDRYLAGDSVLASPVTLARSLIKFATKHRLATSALCVSFITVLLAVVGITGFYIQADRERTWAESQRLKSQQNETLAIDQQRAAEKVLQFLLTTFQLPASSPEGREASVGSLLKMAREEVGRRYVNAVLPGDLLIKADILKALGMSAASMNMPFDARDCLQESLAVLEGLGSTALRDKALCLNELGLALRDTGDYHGAENAQRDAIAMMSRIYGAHHIETGVSLINLAGTLTTLGKYDEADSLLARSLAICDRTLGGKDPTRAALLHRYGLLRYHQNRCDEAENLFNASLAIRRNALPPSDPAIAITLNSIGDIHQSRGHYRQALASYEEARHLDTSYRNANHPMTAITLGRLGELRRKCGDLDNAEGLLNEALAIRNANGLSKHLTTAELLHNLGLVLEQKGENDKAVAFLRDAIAIRAEQLDRDHPVYIANNDDLARVSLKTSGAGQSQPEEPEIRAGGSLEATRL